MFGDAAPHQFEDYVEIMNDPKFSHLELEQLDWEDEADELLRMVSHQISVLLPLRRK